MKCLVFNGWAAGPEVWGLCTFPHDWVFNYVEALDGLPNEVIADFDDVVLVGFSMGGSMALLSALKFPKKIRGLVLISATPRMMEKKDENWPGMSERRRAALKYGTMLTFRDDPSPMYSEVNLERGLEFLAHSDIRSELLELKTSGCLRDIPVYIFQSERDGIVRAHNAEFLRQVFPQAEVRIVPGNEHNLPITIPEEIDAAVFDIIGER